MAENQESFAVRFRPSLMARMVKAAAKQGVRLSEWIRAACVEKLER
jgi:predicted HicB family RNase H-like nuclease